MTDNAKNDKYVVPYIKNLDVEINNIPPQITWDITGKPDINTNVITFYEKTGDYVYSNEQFNINNSGLVIQCRLPKFSLINNYLYF